MVNTPSAAVSACGPVSTGSRRSARYRCRVATTGSVAHGASVRNRCRARGDAPSTASARLGQVLGIPPPVPLHQQPPQVLPAAAPGLLSPEQRGELAMEAPQGAAQPANLALVQQACLVRLALSLPSRHVSHQQPSLSY